MRIALYKGTSLVSKLIKWQTRGEYSHAAVILNDGTVIESWQVGSGVRELKDLSEGHTKGTVVDIFEVFTDTDQDIIIEKFLREQIGKKYDWRAIVRFLTKSSGDNKEKWICSELVFAAFMKALIILLSRTKAHEVSPVLLSRSTLLIKRYSIKTGSRGFYESKD